MDDWRHAHWPPKGMKAISDDPGLPREKVKLFYGNRDQVAAFGETLADAMAGVADHIIDKARGRKPRWMAVPKIIFDVQRVNITHTVGKASRNFTSTSELMAKCGEFPSEVIAPMEEWLQSDPNAILVAHKPVVDQRAYVYCKGEEVPRRVWFLRSGLVLAASNGVEMQIQDQRSIVRDKRSDALSGVIAKNKAGWTVFGVVREKKSG